MWMVFLDYEAFDILRDDPRFVALIRELELPEDIYLQVPPHAVAAAESLSNDL